MNENRIVFLPAGTKQFRILKSKYILKDKNVLLIGAGSEVIAEKMIEAGALNTRMIVNDHESLIQSRLNLPQDSKVVIKMMEFESTDFSEEEFDLVYAQASVSTSARNKIVKEIKRILKPEGRFCVSEITSLKKDIPSFVREIFSASDVLPLRHDQCELYYSERKMEAVYEEDLSTSLKNFYETAAQSLKEVTKNLSDEEKSYYKKIINKISHESNAYLNLGADKYLGLKMLILKKQQ